MNPFKTIHFFLMWWRWNSRWEFYLRHKWKAAVVFYIEITVTILIIIAIIHYLK